MGMALVTQHIMNISQEDLDNTLLTSEGTPNSSNNTERLSYKGEWANA